MAMQQPKQPELHSAKWDEKHIDTGYLMKISSKAREFNSIQFFTFRRLSVPIKF